MTLAYVFWHFAGTYPDTKVSLGVVDSSIVNKQYLYTYETVSDNKVRYEIYQSDKPIKLVNSNIEYMKYNDTNIVFWVVFGIAIIVLIIAFITDDDGWEANKAFDHALAWFTRCEIEQGQTYIYYAFGKLITKTSYKVNYVNVGNIRTLKMSPNYEPLEYQRDRKLNKMGIR
jgi:hypothetical protein